eukprot:Nk52_evm17s294 gene=Nk52_evmTU17s294
MVVTVTSSSKPKDASSSLSSSLAPPPPLPLATFRGDYEQYGGVTSLIRVKGFPNSPGRDQRCKYGLQERENVDVCGKKEREMKNDLPFMITSTSKGYICVWDLISRRIVHSWYTMEIPSAFLGDDAKNDSNGSNEKEGRGMKSDSVGGKLKKGGVGGSCGLDGVLRVREIECGLLCSVNRDGLIQLWNVSVRAGNLVPVLEHRLVNCHRFEGMSMGFCKFGFIPVDCGEEAGNAKEIEEIKGSSKTLGVLVLPTRRKNALCDYFVVKKHHSFRTESGATTEEKVEEGTKDFSVWYQIIAGDHLIRECGGKEEYWCAAGELGVTDEEASKKEWEEEGIEGVIGGDSQMGNNGDSGDESVLQGKHSLGMMMSVCLHPLEMGESEKMDSSILFYCVSGFESGSVGVELIKFIPSCDTNGKVEDRFERCCLAKADQLFGADPVLSVCVSESQCQKVVRSYNGMVEIMVGSVASHAPKCIRVKWDRKIDIKETKTCSGEKEFFSTFAVEDLPVVKGKSFVNHEELKQKRLPVNTGFMACSKVLTTAGKETKALDPLKGNHSRTKKRKPYVALGTWDGKLLIASKSRFVCGQQQRGTPIASSIGDESARRDNVAVLRVLAVLPRCHTKSINFIEIFASDDTTKRLYEKPNSVSNGVVCKQNHVNDNAQSSFGNLEGRASQAYSCGEPKSIIAAASEDGTISLWSVY